MAKRVFILGAGASVHTGAPLMATFLDKARDLYPTIQDQRWVDAANLVFKAISALQRVHSKSELDLFNLESIFTTFEMAATIQQLADLQPDEISKLVESLQTLIVFTLDYSRLFHATYKGWIPSDPYLQLADHIKKFRQQNETTAVITFNYDIGLDFALYYRDLEFSYCLHGKPQTNIIPLLKLHGSINWGTAGPGIDSPIIACPIDSLVKRDYCLICLRQPIGESSSEWCPLKVGSRFFNLINETTQNQVRAAPVIVPPGIYKTDYQSSIRNVWRVAARELADAEYIYVAGYSLPATDYFFHNLYALGTVSSTILRRFTVIDTNSEIESRFKKLLGPAARDRFRPPYLNGFVAAMKSHEYIS